MKMDSIGKKIIVILLPLFIIMLSVSFGISYYLFNQAIEKSVNETACAIGRDYANQIQANVTLEMVKLEELSNMPSIRQGTDQGKIIEAMASAFNRFQKFDTINFIYLDGRSVRYNGSTVDLGDREYFKKVVETKRPFISDPLISKATGKGSVTLAVPVCFNEELIGVLTATYSLARLSDVVSGIHFKDSGYGFVTAKTGLVIAHPVMTEAIGRLDLSQKKIDQGIKLAENELDDKLIGLFKSVSETNSQLFGKYTFNGVSEVAVVTLIQLPGGQSWVMMLSAPEAEVFSEVKLLSQFMLILLVIFFILTVFFITGLSKRFARPIKLLCDECQRLTEGDLREQQIKISGDDEIGQLAKGFQIMRSNLRGVVTQVQTRAEQVAASSGELTAGAQQSAEAVNQVASDIAIIKEGVGKQALLVSKATITAKQNTIKVQQVYLAANEVSQIAESTAETTREGRKSIELAVKSMIQLEHGSESVQQAIAELAQGAKEISEIVNLISTISGQTNLLALNAAIEAARAGRQGRGFAVVADEVRKLAEQCDEAAQKISDLIKKNKEKTDKAIIVTCASAEEIKIGTDGIHSADETFKQIAGMIFKVSKQTSEISEFIKEVSDQEIVMMTSIEDIGLVSRENSIKAQAVATATEEQSATMQQIAASSHNLARLAEDLEVTVAQFKTNN